MIAASAAILSLFSLVIFAAHVPGTPIGRASY
jgi:hypothetical protein